MTGCYADVAMVKAALRIPSTQTGDDAALLALCESVSDAIDRYLGRSAHALTATRYFRWTGAPGHDRRTLRLDRPLIAVTAAGVDEDDDGAYELTLTEGTDYVLEPRNRDANEPALSLRLLRTGSQIQAWPALADAVRITGRWGWSEETEQAGTTAEALDTSETGVDLTAGHAVAIGDTIVVDSEQMFVRAFASANTATVVRAVNGTTAATHLTAAAVAARRYPRALEQAALMQAARFWNEEKSGGAAALGGSVGGFAFNSLYPAIRDLLAPFRLIGVR